MPSLRTTIQLLTMLMATIMATSCIHNDIPYPRIQANILTFDVKGQDGAPIIDTVARTVTVPFPEDADLYNVTVTGYSLTPGSHFVEDPFNTTIDLSTPLPVYIRLYQDWLWTIVARQDIERYFEVEGQMGESTIDVPGHRVVVSVRSSADPAAITIKRIKLGPTGSTMLPELTAGSTFNGTGPFEIEITNYGHSETWSIYV
ncbi:MAG: hypothetical protein K2F78_07325, partial [Muribaculaceae bacterium]|nr:hypothetical protein [Muribaculaceae bacterium]